MDARAGPGALTGPGQDPGVGVGIYFLYEVLIITEVRKRFKWFNKIKCYIVYYFEENNHLSLHEVTFYGLQNLLNLQ